MKPLFRRVLLGLLAILMALPIPTASAVDVFDRQLYTTNGILFSSPDATSGVAGCAVVGNGNLTGNTTAEMIWSFLIGKGLSPVQAAGVMGNLKAESGYVPTRHQSKEDVFNAIGGRAWGLAQWDKERRYVAPDKGILGQLRTKKPHLSKYIDIQYDTVRNKSAVIPPEDLKELMLFELEYLYGELLVRRTGLPEYKQYGNEWEMLKAQTTVEDALVAFHHEFEVSHLMNEPNPRAAVISERKPFADEAFAAYQGAGAITGATPATSTVFLDPGHGATIPQYIDTATGLADRETDNGQETKDMLDVANRAKAELEKLGYGVVLSRTTNDQKVTKRERVTAALAAKASVAVSLHSDTDLNQVWAQKVGTYREFNGKRTTFSSEPTATKSQAIAGTMATARKALEGNDVTTDPDNVTQAGSFGRSGVPSKGNVSLLQLWADTIPWVYNEISRDVGSTGLSEGRKTAYANGVVEAIKQVVSPGTAAGGDVCTTPGGGSLSALIKAYAWADFHPAPYINNKPEYATAVAAAQASRPKRYVGGGINPGVDCGGFVTTLLVDSGFEPRYNSNGTGGNTIPQKAWVDANWQLIGKGTDIKVGGNAEDPKTLKQGDVAFSPGHTFIFAGTIDGFNSYIASASYSPPSEDGRLWRSPMAGKEVATSNNVTWYRKK